MGKIKTWFYVFRQSITNPSYYADVLKVDFWFSFKYLLLLLFIISLVPSISLSSYLIKKLPDIDKVTKQGLNTIKQIYPSDLSLTIIKGKLYTNVKEPYYIDSIEGFEKSLQGSNYNHLITIDTQGIIDDYPKYKTVILVTQDGIIYPSKSTSNKHTQPQVFFFNQIKQNFTFNKRVYIEMVSKIEPYVAYVKSLVIFIILSLFLIAPFLTSLFFLLGKLIQLLYLSLISLILSKLMKVGLEYKEVYRLSMHAITTPILLVAVLNTLALKIQFSYTLCYLVYMVVVFSRLTAKEKKDTLK